MIGKLRNFSAYSAREQILFPEAVIWVTISRLIVSCLPFRLVQPLLAKKEPRNGEPTTAQMAGARRVGRAVRSVARHLPFECLCLVQMLAAKWMLILHGIPSSAYIGVARSEEDGLDSHAWLRCGNVFVTGKQGHERFQIITRFDGQLS